METLPDWAIAAIAGVILVLFFVFVVGRKKDTPSSGSGSGGGVDRDPAPLPEQRRAFTAGDYLIEYIGEERPEYDPAFDTTGTPSPITTGDTTDAADHKVAEPQGEARGHEMEKEMPEQSKGTSESENAGKPVETPAPKAHVVIKDKMRDNSEYMPENAPGGRPDSKMPGEGDGS